MDADERAVFVPSINQLINSVPSRKVFKRTTSSRINRERSGPRCRYWKSARCSQCKEISLFKTFADQLGPCRNDTILALCCYTSRHSTHYLIVSLKAQSDALTFEHSIKLSHGYPTQLHRLITFPSANIAVVQLSHAAIIVSLARDAGREWAVTLKDEEDVFIGVGRGIGGMVRTLATRAGVLGLEINSEAIRQVITLE